MYCKLLVKYLFWYNIIILKFQKSVAILLTAMGRSPDVFEYPDRFIPERWNREEEHVRNTFAHVPFGFGPRMCVGRLFCTYTHIVLVRHLLSRLSNR